LGTSYIKTVLEKPGKAETGMQIINNKFSDKKARLTLVSLAHKSNILPYMKK